MFKLLIPRMVKGTTFLVNNIRVVNIVTQLYVSYWYELHEYFKNHWKWHCLVSYSLENLNHVSCTIRDVVSVLYTRSEVLLNANS